MVAPPNSQAVPLPQNLPFRLVKTEGGRIGAGAYASVRKALPLTADYPVVAVKFINKAHAYRIGRLREKQINLELSLHRSVGGEKHPHIVRYLQHGEDDSWFWLCMEYAEGGDLFDVIEADAGVPGDDIAHLFFSQLLSAVTWCHSKGVAHRDIKPENILLSKDADLKLADFGLATQFRNPKTQGTKQSHMVCGSPPYIAPEILAVGHANLKRAAEQDKASYAPEVADIWSMAIVLFVLFAGNTPWDSPDPTESYEYNEFVKLGGRQAPNDELWPKIPSDALSLLLGMLTIDASARMNLKDIHKHPWLKQNNNFLDQSGNTQNGLLLATRMFSNLRVDVNREIKSSQVDAMDIDRPSQPMSSILTSTQPITPMADHEFDFGPSHRPMDALTLERLADEPAMSQFSSTPQVPLSLTQVAKHYSNVLPPHAMNQFTSTTPLIDLHSALTTALQHLGATILEEPSAQQSREGQNVIVFKVIDRRKIPAHGSIIIRSRGNGVHDVIFRKTKGDPIGWRVLFKDVAVLCKDTIVKMDNW